MKIINQMEPSFDDEEREAVNDYLKSGGWITEFKKTREFESVIAAYCGSKHCSVVSNGTIALTAALMACNVGAGDEVIVPDYTMVATPNSAAILGAKVVFADIERKSLCLDFEKMKKAVTNKTKALMLVTINGRYPENIEEYVDFCRKKGIWLVEDAAQSLGSKAHGKHLGTFGDLGCLSFSSPKIISTGQGGAILGGNEELMERVRKIRDFGREKPGSDHYLTMGWNFKFTDLQAVIGLEQMKKLPWRVERKKALGKLYDKLLAGLRGAELIPTNYADTAPWFFDILADRREALQAFLDGRGIKTRPFYPALHSEPAYGLKGSYPIAEEVARRGLWLPSSVSLKDEDVEHVCSMIREFCVKQG
ncbi:UDP-4-amino-4-deoxy-L-arabinose--oxoglutarate aminotransferase [Candidatus Burarchaeum australiense]|nr:UDP-4-amino-4-deoxy-L-arabinose--oxoglutarate aminotransferase [Candidatus Burarchaeum australiense]